MCELHKRLYKLGKVRQTFVFVIGVSAEATPTARSHLPPALTPPYFRLGSKVPLTPQHMFSRTGRVKQLLPESAAGGSERVKLCMSSEQRGEGERGERLARLSRK